MGLYLQNKDLSLSILTMQLSLLATSSASELPIFGSDIHDTYLHYAAWQWVRLIGIFTDILLFQRADEI